MWNQSPVPSLLPRLHPCNCRGRWLKQQQRRRPHQSAARLCGNPIFPLEVSDEFHSTKKQNQEVQRLKDPSGGPHRWTSRFAAGGFTPDSIPFDSVETMVTGPNSTLKKTQQGQCHQSEWSPAAVAPSGPTGGRRQLDFS